MTDNLSSRLGSELARLTPEFTSKYDEGRKLGAEGREPPMTFNQVTLPKQVERMDLYKRSFGEGPQDYFTKKNFKDAPVVGVEANPAAASFRQGYLDGLDEFVASNGIGIWTTRLLSELQILSSEEGLGGFVRGIRLESPSTTPKDYSQVTKDSFWAKFFESELEVFLKTDFRNSITQQGYRIGFVLGVARDHNVALKGFEMLPVDALSYQAFMQGLN